MVISVVEMVVVIVEVVVVVMVVEVEVEVVEVVKMYVKILAHHAAKYTQNIENNYLRDPVFEAPRGVAVPLQVLCNQSRRCCYLQRVKMHLPP